MPLLVVEVIWPTLLMPPVKVGPVTLIAVGVAASLALLPIKMPRLVASTVPLSTIAPVMVLFKTETPTVAAIVPLLLILPEKADAPEHRMPVLPDIAPLLVMPP